MNDQVAMTTPADPEPEPREPRTRMGRELLMSWTEPNAEQLADRSAWTRQWLALRIPTIEDEAEAQRAPGDGGLAAALEALRDISFTGMDVPAAMATDCNESFYRRQLMNAIGTAARALSAIPPAPPSAGVCPAGCGCRLWTDDADRHDCGCDGPCCWLSWDDYMVDVLTRPEYYRELRADRGEPVALGPSAQEGAVEPGGRPCVWDQCDEMRPHYHEAITMLVRLT